MFCFGTTHGSIRTGLVGGKQLQGGLGAGGFVGVFGVGQPPRGGRMGSPVKPCCKRTRGLSLCFLGKALLSTYNEGPGRISRSIVGHIVLSDSTIAVLSLYNRQPVALKPVALHELSAC